MNAPIVLACEKCLRESEVDVALEQWACPFCGHVNEIAYFTAPVARKILRKARREYLEGDYCMAIVFSAMSLDSELGRLFFAWRPIIDTADGPYRERMEIDLRNLGEASERVEAVAKLLDPYGIDNYVATHPKLATSLAAIPSLHGIGLAKAFERFLFWPSNAILHQGKTHWERGHARGCFNLALFGLEIFKSMDASAQRHIALARRNAAARQPDARQPDARQRDAREPDEWEPTALS